MSASRAGVGEAPARRDAEANRERLLAAAARTLAEDPAASMADIATAAGVGRATAWRHLGSREEVVADLHEHALQDAATALAEVLDGADAVTPATIGATVDALGAIGDRYRALRRIGPPDEGSRRAWQRTLHPLREAIARGQAAGTLRDDVDPEILVAILTGSVAAALDVEVGSRAPRAATGAVRRLVEDALRPAALTPRS